ncbi:NAD(P)H:quinone oxidoreductase [Actinomycetospora atypica]|uniref:NAD(P)H:quinone oxidoreductase n=1 Tax=Actinomycetospora atypica TaxID=1290095 RepID=A0ABV9YGZ7_9PSEU
MATKVAVIYYSQTGTIHELAQEYAAGAEKAGAEVRLRSVTELAPQSAIDSNEKWKNYREQIADQPEATADDILWADAVIFGTPTRYGNVSAQLKQFLDQLGPQWAQGQLADKVYSGFTASSTLHGGQESTLLALYNTIYHFGGFIVPPGYTDGILFQTGNPYGVSHVDGQGTIPVSDETRQAARYTAERVTGVTSQLLAGRDAALAAS